mmetsp:Transcript_43820/g.124939  ORF Transcript_43820/g.124939 Transcript_43820/m.124939 type:complete len:235 (-) Transcript_43820:1010-1714(-)
MVCSQPLYEPVGRPFYRGRDEDSWGRSPGPRRDRELRARLRAHPVPVVRGHADCGPSGFPRLRARPGSSGPLLSDREAQHELHERQAECDAVRGAGRRLCDHGDLVKVPQGRPEVRAHHPHPQQARQVLQGPDLRQRQQVGRWLRRPPGRPCALLPDPPMVGRWHSMPGQLCTDAQREEQGGHQRDGGQAAERQVHADNWLREFRKFHGEENRATLQRGRWPGACESPEPQGQH